MTEELGRTEIEYTHTYDQFTVFFYGNHVFVGKNIPLDSAVQT